MINISGSLNRITHIKFRENMFIIDFFNIKGYLKKSIGYFIIYLAVRWFSVIHLVNSEDHLFYSKSVCKKGMFTSLTIFGNTGFEFSNTSSYNKYCTISLKMFSRINIIYYYLKENCIITF